MNNISIYEKHNDWLTLIHYGNKLYDKTKVKPIKNAWVKPEGGLWTSPVWSDHSWKNWCEDSDFRNNSEELSFKLKFKDSKILVIDSENDVLDLPNVKHDLQDILTFFDFEAIQKDYDAIWLTEPGEHKTRLCGRRTSLYGWDCESVLILNPDCCYQTL
jgi:hypothetical protein